MYLIGKWRFLLSRHLQIFTNATSSRTLYRRLNKLIEQNYLERRRLLYGVPGLYVLTHKGRIAIGLNKRADKIKLEQVEHDIIVLDTVSNLIKNEKIEMTDIISERELHSKDGFGTRKHHPDYVYQKDNQSYAVEVELTLKAKDRLEENIKLNYLNYDYQIWFLKRENKKLNKTVSDILTYYANTSIRYLDEVI